MISEWLEKTFGEVRYSTNFRLGAIQPKDPDGRYTTEELTMLGVWRRRIDAVVYLPDRLLLVEAVMRAEPGKISVLSLYSRLVPHTPELAEYAHLPYTLILLYCIEDPVLNVIAREQGILPIQFVPSFFDEWFKKRLPRHQRASSSQF